MPHRHSVVTTQKHTTTFRQNIRTAHSNTPVGFMYLFVMRAILHRLFLKYFFSLHEATIWCWIRWKCSLVSLAKNRSLWIFLLKKICHGCRSCLPAGVKLTRVNLSLLILRLAGFCFHSVFFFFFGIGSSIITFSFTHCQSVGICVYPSPGEHRRRNIRPNTSLGV